MQTLYNIEEVDSNNAKAIIVNGIGKKYFIHGQKEEHNTLRDKLVYSMRNLGKTIRERKTNIIGSEEMWAVRDVTFDVNKGEVIGIIGKNGAGKSTLLKMLTQITSQTEGRAEIHGRVGSLLEVGTGFHQELTGRENVYLSGAILGMKKQEISAKFHEIVSFSGIGKYIDVPVKRYSSGMTVRLGFAVAAHLEPEILLIDEVLAVGDVEFQRKCLGKMSDVANGGRTILFVSHNMGAMRALCPKCILMDKGRIVMYDKTDKVIQAYLHEPNDNNGYRELGLLDGRTRFISISILNSKNEHSTKHDILKPVKVSVEYHIAEPIKGLVISFNLFNSFGAKVFMSQNRELQLNGSGDAAEGIYVATVTIPPKFLAPGVYTITTGLHIPKVFTYDVCEHAIGFTVIESGSDKYFWAGQDIGVVLFDVPWEVYRTGSSK